MGLSSSARLKFQNGGDDMATTSIADKLAKLEKKIAKRQATIAEEQEQLDKELAEYDKLYLTALASKYKLSGKDLFSAIEREHDQLEKLREGEQSDDDADSNSSVTDDEEKQDDTAVKHSSFPFFITMPPLHFPKL